MNPDSAIFSPTASETASFCMRKWGFYKRGYKSRIIQYPQICAIVGTGFAAGAAHINIGVKQGEAPAKRLDSALVIAQEAVQGEVRAFLDAGASVAPKDEKTFDAISHLVELAVTLFVKKYPHEGTILKVEQAYHSYGNARLDLLYVRAVDQQVVVNDYKVKVKLQPQWMDKEFSRYQRSPQLYQYAAMSGATAYEITFIVLGPQPKVIVKSYEINSAFHELWAYDTMDLWARMTLWKDSSLAKMPGSLVHEDKWGVCEYAGACLEGRLDEASLALDFIKVERRVKP